MDHSYQEMSGVAFSQNGFDHFFKDMFLGVLKDGKLAELRVRQSPLRPLEDFWLDFINPP